jgi:16S rRNA (cytidine1402-2'-O)-methyltransferase
MPELYVVATPIGNLEDITLRAIRILKEVKLIAAEDTRKTHQLLSHYGITTPTTSYHEHNKLTKLDYILNKLETEDVALVSDAGMPGISDPGYELILAAQQNKIQIVPIPGPSVPITALAASGLPTDSFCFHGFLPSRAGQRRRWLKSESEAKSTIILFEAPHRIIDSLRDMREIWGDRKITVCRELTKIHEEIFRGSISEAIGHFTSPKGEFTLIVGGKPEEPKPEVSRSIVKRLRQAQKSGLTAKDAVSQISAETGISKKEIYREWLNIKSKVKREIIK